MSSDPNAKDVNPPHIKKFLATLDDTGHDQSRQHIQDHFAEVSDLEQKKRYWIARSDTTASDAAVRESKLVPIQKRLDELTEDRKRLRGDFGDLPQAVGPITSTCVNSPTPLTTSDVAHCFAGLHWPTADAWKKPLGDKPKWLRDCVVIRGSQGRSETRWNPVLIGAALVRNGHAKPNSVRAKFQTVALLRPWLEAWKTYEADNLDD